MVAESSSFSDSDLVSFDIDGHLATTLRLQWREQHVVGEILAVKFEVAPKTSIKFNDQISLDLERTCRPRLFGADEYTFHITTSDDRAAAPVVTEKTIEYRVEPVEIATNFGLSVCGAALGDEWL